MKRRAFLQTATAAAALPAPFAIAQPARARTLRFVPQANLTLLDPIFTTALVTINHGWAIYDTLFGADIKQNLKPQMADGYTVSDDGRTYLIKLREGLKFHNGEPVRAQDCAQSLIRWAARETIGQTVWKFVDSCGAQDDRTIKITLRQSLPIFIEAIGKGGASVPFVMPEHLARTDPFKQVTETIGSGPFKFVKAEFVPGSSVVYEKNPDYVPRQEPAEWTAGGKVAHFDRVEWRVIPELGDRLCRVAGGRGRLVRAGPGRPRAAAAAQSRRGDRQRQSHRVQRHPAVQPPASAVQQRRGPPRRADGDQSARLHGRDHRRRQHRVQQLQGGAAVRHTVWP